MGLKKTLTILGTFCLVFCMAAVLLSVSAQAAAVREASTWAALQAQINEAASGDTIYISNGVDAITAGPDDGMLEVKGNKSITLDLNGQAIDRNLASIDTDGHVIIVRSGSTLTIIDSSGDNSGVITGGWANNGGAVNNQGTLIIEGGTFAGNKATNGGAIRNYGKLTITGGVFKENVITGGGGAIWSNGTAEISNAVFTGNTGATNGGAIANHGTMTVTECTIENNTASAGGGAIFTGNNGDSNVTAFLTVADGTIRNNSARLGGGVYVDTNTAKLTSDVQVVENNATEKGGGVYIAVSANGTGKLITDNGTSISGNTASEGGGIYIDKLSVPGTFVGEITVMEGSAELMDTDVNGNTAAADGGGISNNGELILNGGDYGVCVMGNTCGGVGGGIRNNGTLKVQGMIDVEDNTGAPTSSNVYLTAGKKITLTGALADGSCIGVTSEIANAVLTSGYGTYNAGTAPEEIFFTNEGYVIRVNDGELRARLAQTVSYYDPIDKTDKTKEECLVVDSTATRWEDDWYVVTGSVRIDSRVRVSGNVNLILTNGANLTVPKGISVPAGTSFTVWGQIEDYIISDDYKQAGHLETSAYDANGDLFYPDRYHAGVGGDYDGEEYDPEKGYDCGNITINGGRISAFGGNYGPGIGSTVRITSEQSVITVNNGLIISYGGPCDDDGDAYSGAGIGGGYWCTSPRIIINGGGIYAQGSGGAAGIGGGYNGYYRPITITGGEVFAYGSPYAAGIGLGAFESGFYTGALASSLGGGLIDIQGGKVVAVSMLRNDKTYIQQGDDPHGIDTGAGAFVYGQRNNQLAFHGGVHLYDGAKVTYVRNFVSESEGSAPEVVFSSGNAYTVEDLTERVWILMNSYKVTVEPCDHAGAAYVPSLTPSLGHIMHCATCNLEETVEPHTYDSTGKCTLCGYQYTGTLYTISFDSIDGTGEMNSESAVPDSTYTLPACGFTAPEGQMFKEWSVKIGNAEAVSKQPGDTVTVTADTTVTAVWEDKMEPAFKVQSLRLAGEIGVNFFLDLSSLTYTQKEDSYMIFDVGTTVTGRRVEFNPSFMNSTDEYYGFTCYVNAVQMADEITATYHYTQDGAEHTIQKTYSVEDYITARVGNSDTTEKERDLIKALNDYGYYAQQYLSGLRGWTLDVDYAGMTDPYTDSYDFASMADLMEEYKVDKDLRTDVEKVTFALVLDSSTSIYLYVKPQDGYSGSVSAKVNGSPAKAVQGSDGRYRITIFGISAHKLGDTYAVTITTANGESTVDISAMSYVYACLTNKNSSTAEKNCATALGSYYAAAVAFKNAQNS